MLKMLNYVFKTTLWNVLFYRNADDKHRMMTESLDTGDMGPEQEHTQTLLLNIQDLASESLFSDLQIICDDGAIPSYW